MSSIIFDRFLGLDKKSSDTDLDIRASRTLQNLSTTKKPGALVKSGFYKDVSSSLTGGSLSSGTIKNIFQFGLTSPANTDLYLLHVQDASGNNRVYVGQDNNDSDISQMPATGWRELTEHEGEYTLTANDIAAGTNANKIVIDSSNSDYAAISNVTDYYKDWILIIDIAAKEETAAIVSSSSQVVNTKSFILLNGAITGVAAGDKFTLARANIHSFGIGKTRTGTPPRYANISKVDDIIRWTARENSAVGMTGNEEQFPTQYNILYSYVNRTFGTGGNAVAFNDFVLDVQQLLKPYVDDTPTGSRESIIQSVTDTAAGTFTGGLGYEIAIAFLYDGIEIGQLSSIYNYNTGGTGNTRAIHITIQLPFKACYRSASGKYISCFDIDRVNEVPEFYDYSLISRRITAVRIYVNDFLSSTSELDLYFQVEKTIASFNTNDIDFSMTSEGFLELTVTLTDPVLGNKYLDDIGQTNIRPNFKYGSAISTHFIGAAIRTQSGDRKNNNLIASIVDGAGVSAVDTFGSSNVINLGFFGSKQITGIHVLGDEGVDSSPKARALVFSDDDYYVLDIVPGASFSHRLDNIGLKEGLFAPDSLVYAEGNLFGVSRNGFRLFSVQGTKIIGEGLKNDFDALTDPSECVSGYLKTDRLILFHFKTDSKTYYVDLLSENFQMGEFLASDSLVWIASVRSGKALSTDGSKLYEHGTGTDQNGTAVVPTWKSKRFNARDMGGISGDEIIFTQGFIKYKSDTAITLDFFLDNSSTAITFNSLSLPAKTDESEVKFQFPLGTRGYEGQIEVKLNSTQKATNTVFELNGIRIDGYFKRKRN